MMADGQTEKIKAWQRKLEAAFSHDGIVGGKYHANAIVEEKQTCSWFVKKFLGQGKLRLRITKCWKPNSSFAQRLTSFRSTPRRTRSKRMRSALILAAALAGARDHAQAQQGGCLSDLGQTICSPPGGAIIRNEFGQIVCGRGQCIRNLGQIVCSAQPGGYAFLELGQARCTGGCEPAATSNCQRPQ